jgi:hypothetical protein
MLSLGLAVCTAHAEEVDFDLTVTGPGSPISGNIILTTTFLGAGEYLVTQATGYINGAGIDSGIYPAGPTFQITGVLPTGQYSDSHNDNILYYPETANTFNFDSDGLAFYSSIPNTDLPPGHCFPECVLQEEFALLGTPGVYGIYDQECDASAGCYFDAAVETNVTAVTPEPSSYFVPITTIVLLMAFLARKRIGRGLRPATRGTA